MPSAVVILGMKFFSLDKNFKGKSTKNPRTFLSNSSFPFLIKTKKNEVIKKILFKRKHLLESDCSCLSTLACYKSPNLENSKYYPMANI